MAGVSQGTVALVIRHQDDAHLGSFGPVLEAHGYEIRHLDASAVADAPDDAHLVIVLGGDMGAYETERYPYLVDEIAFLARRLEAEQPTLGICLGAQVMSDALGGRASPGKSNVIGFRDIQLTDAGHDSPLRHFDGVKVMQWHGDSFRLPAGATRLASSAEYSNEGFRMGDYALAIQFHPELTAQMYEEWAAGGAAELAANGIAVSDLLAERDRHHADMQRASASMLAEWLETL